MSKANVEQSPFLSVVICTRNRERHITEALDSWVRQQYDPGRFEVIVVDNGSIDRTPRLVEDFIAAHPDYQIRLIREPAPGLAAARNTGIRAARGRYIAFVDDDARAHSEYIRRFEAHTLRLPHVAAFGGRVRPDYEEGQPPTWMSPFMERFLAIVDKGDRPKPFGRKYPVGCNMLFRRDVFDRVGMFDPRIRLRSEDKYIFQRIKEAGLPVWYLPDVEVKHFIEAFRAQCDYVRKVSYLNGQSERLLIRYSARPRRRYFLAVGEMAVKWGISLMLWGWYALMGRSIKGRAIWRSTHEFIKGFRHGPGDTYT